MIKETKITNVRDILRQYLADCLVDDIMADMTTLTEEKLEDSRMESLITVTNKDQNKDVRMAWYTSHMGEMDMCKMLGLITEKRRQELYHEWRSHHP